MNIFSLFEKIKNNSKSSIEKIIVGLGNPYPKYDNTRHNAGFEALDYIAKKYDVKFQKQKFNSVIADVMIKNKHCIMLKPLTFMNNSGEAVICAMNFYKLPIEEIIVLVDDISFEPGSIKIKKQGSAGGHNGLKSIIYETDRQDFCRIRIGVGAKPFKEYPLAKWVVSKFSEPEKEKIKMAHEKILTAVELIVEGEVEKAMNLFN